MVKRGVYMFSVYNLDFFGLKLKTIRKQMGYTQLEVSRISGINRDTLRRIEQGESIPRYDTLEVLSSVYKVDLLEQLKFFRSSNRLYSYYQRLDKLIADFDIEILSKLTQDFDVFMANQHEVLLDPHIYDQFKLMLKGISAYHSNDSVRQLQSLDDFISSIRKSIPDFDVYEFRKYKYNLFEMRILLLIGLSYNHYCNYNQSNAIMDFLLDIQLKDNHPSYESILLTIKIYCNLSYNCFCLDNYKASLDYANTGIAYCNKHNNMFFLFHFYYRKGVAEFRLNMPHYEDSLRKSIHLLEIQNKMDLAETYRQTLIDRYDIDLSK